MPTKGEKDWPKSVNFRLVQKGLAGLSLHEDEEPPENYAAWQAAEEEAREGQIGVWQFGGADAFDEEND
jgi:endonuclease YncB( thermonuclease family)